jgi:hypothetical protein
MNYGKHLAALALGLLCAAQMYSTPRRPGS